jgi:CRISP-associated protein Cas1
MPSIYLDRQNLTVRADQGRLHIASPDGDAQSIPLSLIDRVIVMAHAMIDSRVLSSLVSQGAVLAVVSRRDPTLVATLGMAARPSAARRIAQYRAYCRPETRSKIARAIVRHKLRIQANSLRKLAPSRIDARHDLLKAAAQIEAARASLPSVALESLLGVEGSAAAAYFAAYSSLFAPSLKFTTRNRRPPRDPVNVALSLGYTLLHVEAVRAVALAGLDPYIGFLHDLHHGRESLACDLVELERTNVDEWTFCAFRDRLLRGEHFRTTDGACLMGKAGRRAFYSGFQGVSESAARRLRHWTHAVIRFLNTNSEEHLFAKSVSVPEQPGSSQA